jgi:hypothetical protein
MRPTKRKTSKFVADKVLDAWEPLRRADPDAVAAAVASYREQIQANAEVPIHIQIIRRFGANIADAERGFTDAEIAAYAEAQDLARREMERPEDFQSEHQAKSFGRQGGAPAVHKNEEIKSIIKDVLDNHHGNKPMKGTEVISEVQQRLTAHGKPVPEKTKIRSLLTEVKKVR